MTETSFEWTREVPEEWTRQLDHLWPGERVTRPVLGWLAGFPYEPVCRWAIWEVQPAATVGRILAEEVSAGVTDSLVRMVWDALHGEDPRTLGAWVPAKNQPGTYRGDSPVKVRWRSTSAVSRNQWDIHRQTGGLPQLVWIIEGAHGGHAWQFGHLERGFLLDGGVDPETIEDMATLWPNPGSQPYAEFGEATLAALRERDLLQRWHQGRSWTERVKRSEAGVLLEAETRERQRGMQLRMMHWLDQQIGAVVSDIPRRLLPQWSDFRTTDEPPDDEAAVHDFLED